MIQVAVDGRRLQDRPFTGVGRGLANVLPYLARGAEITLLTDERRPPASVEGVHEVALPGIGRLPEPAWLQVSVSRWLRRHPQVFHGVYNAVPFLYRGPTVVTIHDLSWVHHPEDFTAPRRSSFAIQARWSVRTARMIVTVSNDARDAIVETYGVAKERVEVAYNAVDPVFGPERASGAEDRIRSLGLDGPYVIALGGAPRRGLEVAVAAWRRATDASATRAPALVVVGREAPPREEGVFYAGPVDDATWATLLAGAAAFVYPTRFEGFGMPALEAAASGVPVVCARVGPLPEVLGDAAEWCPSTTVDDMAAGLRRVLTDHERGERLRQAGLARAASLPTWKDAADVILGCYRKAAA